VEPIENSNSLHKPIREVCRKQEKRRLRQRRQLEQLSKETNKAIFDAADISQDAREAAETEIFLRTSGSAEIREVPDPDSVPEVPENIDKPSQRPRPPLRHGGCPRGIGRYHPTSKVQTNRWTFSTASSNDLKTRTKSTPRIDSSRSTTSLSRIGRRRGVPQSPSVRRDDLFDYHVDTIENTPIPWKISTERLLADAKGEGFACLVDYHQLDTSLFDRLSNQYLEPRKAELRERRSAANQRRNDESLYERTC